MRTVCAMRAASITANREEEMTGAVSRMPPEAIENTQRIAEQLPC